MRSSLSNPASPSTLNFQEVTVSLILAERERPAGEQHEPAARWTAKLYGRCSTIEVSNAFLEMVVRNFAHGLRREVIPASADSDRRYRDDILHDRSLEEFDANLRGKALEERQDILRKYGLRRAAAQLSTDLHARLPSGVCCRPAQREGKNGEDIFGVIRIEWSPVQLAQVGDQLELETHQ